MSEWKEYRLGDVTEWASGGTPSKKNEIFWNGDIPWISASSMKGNRYSQSELKITEAGLNAGSRIAEKDSILLLVRGSTLHQRILVGIAERDVAFNQDVKSIKPKQEYLDSWYLLFWFMSIKKELLNMVENTGIGAGKLDTKLLQNLIIKIPPKEERERIKACAKDIDDKLILNSQTSQTLEQIAQAIFKSWFVDFEPVKAKIKARQNCQDPELAAMCAISGKTEEQLKVLDDVALKQLKSTAALFSEALVESEQGKIPEGWDIKSMEQLSTIVAMGPFGSNIKVSTFVDDGIPVISGQHLKGIMLEDNKFNFVTLDHADKLNKSNVQRGDVVFTHAGSIGQVAYIPDNSKYERYVLSQRQFYMRPDQKIISPLFIVNYFKSHLGQYELLANASQVGVPSISRPVSNLRKIEAVIPNKDLSDEFHNLISNIYNKISQAKDETNSLEMIRDRLLPKLLSGELSIIKTQTELEEAI